jgi:two-component system, OmpR family, KDP operon response regulator KdpE
MTQSDTILVIEDESLMRRVLRFALHSQGYHVAEAADGAQALTRLAEHMPDLIILDLGLPDIDGVELATTVRRRHDVPIIVLSARDEERQQIRALDAGANDYVTKPFREGELMARVRAALRRDRRKSGTELEIGDLRLRLEKQRLFVRDNEIALTPTEFKLLFLLARDAGRVLTHHQLLSEVWGPGHAEQVHYLRVYMKQLRQKIEDDPSQPKRILTAPGVGYRLRQIG